MRKKVIVVIGLLIVLSVIGGFVYFNFIKDPSNSDMVVNDPAIKALAPVTLTIYLDGVEPEGFSEVVKEIERRTNAFLNASFDFKWISADTYDKQIYEKLNSNSNIDAFYAGGLEGDILKAQNEGLLKDITKIFPKYAPNYYSNYEKEELALASTKGKLYEIPNRYPIMQRYSAFIREDLRVKYGISEIKSYADLQAYIETVAKNEKDIVPIAVGGGSSFIDMFASANGYVVLDDQLDLVYKWDDPKMRIVPWEQTPEYRNIINQINEWKQLGGNFVWGLTPDDALVSSGECACFLTTWSSEFFKNVAVKSSSVSYKQYSLYSGNPSERSNMHGAICFNAKSPNIERMMRFIEWVESSKENYKLVLYGVAGKDNGKHYSGISRAVVLVNINNELYAGGIVDKNLEEIKSLTKYPPHSGFQIDTEKLDGDSLTKRGQSFSNVGNLMISGSFSNEKQDNFIEQQKKDVGINKIVMQVQKQLDDWRAGNK